VTQAVPFPRQFRSQAFSTSQRFPSKLEFHGLVSCRNRSWTVSLQSFPLAEVVHPSRGHQLPCGHPPPCRSDRSPPVQRLVVSPTPGPFGPVAWFPLEPWAPFPRGASPASWLPWAARGLAVPDGQLHPLRSVPPSANPFESTRANPHRRSLLSWVSSPSETLFTPRSLDPPRSVDLRSHPASRPSKTSASRGQRP
jgi:hypothetical protein